MTNSPVFRRVLLSFSSLLLLLSVLGRSQSSAAPAAPASEEARLKNTGSVKAVEAMVVRIFAKRIFAKAAAASASASVEFASPFQFSLLAPGTSCGEQPRTVAPPLLLRRGRLRCGYDCHRWHHRVRAWRWARVLPARNRQPDDRMESRRRQQHLRTWTSGRRRLAGRWRGHYRGAPPQHPLELHDERVHSLVFARVVLVG